MTRLLFAIFLFFFSSLDFQLNFYPIRHQIILIYSYIIIRNAALADQTVSSQSYVLHTPLRRTHFTPEIFISDTTTYRYSSCPAPINQSDSLGARMALQNIATHRQASIL